MSWEGFIGFAVVAVCCWAAGAFFAWKDRRLPAAGLTILGLLVFLAFIVGMWISLERPPLRTQGETRLWYAFFLPMCGVIVYSRWRYKWILGFTTLLSLVFICINLFRPEIHDKTLMPALQSPWFAPHVIVYMLSYALLGAATLMALYLLLFRKGRATADEMAMTDNLVYVGLAFLTFGMLFGALWAREAWGTYWSWDPKETWAAVTWLGCLVYIHFRKSRPAATRTALWLLVFAYACLQMCWWGINFLESARATSIHVYG